MASNKGICFPVPACAVLCTVLLTALYTDGIFFQGHNVWYSCLSQYLDLLSHHMLAHFFVDKEHHSEGEWNPCLGKINLFIGGKDLDSNGAE